MKVRAWTLRGPTILRIGEHPQTPEVDLAFDTRFAVDDPNGEVLATEPVPFGGEPVQCPVRHRATLTGQQHSDL